MSLLTVTYSSCVRLSCANRSSAAVIICLNQSRVLQPLTGGPKSTITGTLISTVPFRDVYGNQAYSYTFSYDDAQLEPTNPVTIPLTEVDILGVQCEGCLTTFIRENGGTGGGGVAGPQGPMGAQGVAGAQGAQGAQGVAGPQGPAGAAGAAGVAGPAGAAGAQGPAGVQGPPGAQGLQGIPGVGVDETCATITQTAHGMGTSGQVKAAKVSSGGVWSLATADAEINAADAVVQIIDGNNFKLLNGVVTANAHGLTPLFKWLAVSRTSSGAFVDASTLSGPGLIQNALLPLTANCLYVELESPFQAFGYCSLITQTAHGLSVPTSGVLPLRWNTSLSKWVPADASSVTNSATVYLTRVVDANTFELTPSGFIFKTAHGLTVGTDYYLSPLVPGGLVPLSSLAEEDCKQRILTVLSPTCLILQPCCLDCTVAEEPPPPPSGLNVVFTENFDAAGPSYDNAGGPNFNADVLYGVAFDSVVFTNGIASMKAEMKTDQCGQGGAHIVTYTHPTGVDRARLAVDFRRSAHTEFPGAQNIFAIGSSNPTNPGVIVRANSSQTLQAFSAVGAYVSSAVGLLVPDAWVRIMLEVILNTPGVPDGVVILTVGGVELINTSAAQIRESGETWQIRAGQLRPEWGSGFAGGCPPNPNVGMSPPPYVLYDNFVFEVE